MSVRKRASAIVIREQDSDYSDARPHSGDEFHTVPGGGIENGEDPADTAVRKHWRKAAFTSLSMGDKARNPIPLRMER